MNNVEKASTEQERMVLQEVVSVYRTCNGRQNSLRHFVPKGLSDVLLTSKGENSAVLCRCSSYLSKTTNTPTLNGGERGGVWFFWFSEVTLFEYNVSTILSPTVGVKSDSYFSVCE